MKTNPQPVDVFLWRQKEIEREKALYFCINYGKITDIAHVHHLMEVKQVG
ncbi:hypothetical protein KSD_01160 [Ktedonobacter sp. SOSP1-85]|nr:hypothetical protein KSD_01160 [Ktedonobacter sp. SOSP1-85]